MDPYPIRKTERLHLGRISTAESRYFVTFVTAERKPWLARPVESALMKQALQSWHTSSHRNGRIFAATVMPDHVHVLFSPGNLLSVGQCVARWKAEVSRKIFRKEEWQRDFWEHRIRADEPEEDYGFYMFLNPYRAGLIEPQQTWPGWWVSDPKRFSFLASLDAQGVPPKEWMDWPTERFAELDVGE